MLRPATLQGKKIWMILSKNLYLPQPPPKKKQQKKNKKTTPPQKKKTKKNQPNPEWLALFCFLKHALQTAHNSVSGECHESV